MINYLCIKKFNIPAVIRVYNTKSLHSCYIIVCLLLKELHRRNHLHQDPSKTKALQTIIEMKVRA